MNFVREVFSYPDHNFFIAIFNLSYLSSLKVIVYNNYLSILIAEDVAGLKKFFGVLNTLEDFLRHQPDILKVHESLSLSLGPELRNIKLGKMVHS